MSGKVAIIVKDSIERVWECWTQADHIKEWYHAADGWYVPNAEVDFKVKGKFNIKMAAINKRGSFDFNGIYTEIKEHEHIHFTIDDGRKVIVKFEAMDAGILVTEQFETTSAQSPAEQETGWQMILFSFKKYVEKG